MRLPHTDPACGAWKPEVTVLNQTEGLATASPLRTIPQEDGSTKCILAYTLKGIFAHTYDLRTFPFDEQTLRVRCVLWRSPLEKVDAESTTPFRGRLDVSFGKHMLYEDGFIQQDVWIPHQHSPVTLRHGHTDERYRSVGDGQRFSTIDVEINIRRRCQFYVFNVFLMFDLFVCLSLNSFGVEIDSSLVSDRLSIVLNQVLTSAAFKVIVSNMTPAVGYLTLIDAFIFLCFAFMGAVAACAVVISLELNKHGLPWAVEFNRRMGIALCSLWAAVHVMAPVILVQCANAHTRSKAKADEVEETNRNRWKQFSLQAMSRTLTMHNGHSSRHLADEHMRTENDGNSRH